MSLSSKLIVNFTTLKVTQSELAISTFRFNGHFSMWTWVSRYQNVSVLAITGIGAEDDGGGGDSWSCKTCKAPVKSSPPTNQHPAFHRPDALSVAQPAVWKSTEGNRMWLVDHESWRKTNIQSDESLSVDWGSASPNQWNGSEKDQEIVRAWWILGRMGSV